MCKTRTSKRWRVIKTFMDKINEKMEVMRALQGNKVGKLVVAAFLMVLIFVATGCTGGGGNADMAANIPTPETGASASQPQDAQLQDQNPEMGSDVIDIEAGTAAQKPDKASKKKKDAATAEGEDVDVIASQDDKTVLLTVEDSGRSDPFLPYNEAKAADEANKGINLEKAKLEYDLVEPPKSASSDPEAEKILTTKVSGIMYDKDSPSAILNIEGADYLVRSGDVVNGYKILSIQPTVVTVQLGSNVYQAGVGQLLVTDGINYNTISNLENKFGGSKK